MEQTPRRRPKRTCIACRKTDDKGTFIRFVRSSETQVDIDVSGKAKGRGAYVCASTDCFESVCRRHRLNAALKINLSDDEYIRLAGEFNALVNMTDAQ